MPKDRALDRHDTTKTARVVRLPLTEWEAYGETVGDGRRTADLVAYIRWRIKNPSTPLP